MNCRDTLDMPAHRPIIAAIVPRGENGADDLVASLSFFLINQGWRVRGMTQEKFRKNGRCQYALVDLETGVAHAISQNLGMHSKSCALNLQSMAEASLILKRIADEGADIAVVNRFGKQEAMGQGFAAEMLEIMSRGIPLITIVKDEHLPVWRSFTGGVAAELPNSMKHVMSWLNYKMGSPPLLQPLPSQNFTAGLPISHGAALAHGCAHETVRSGSRTDARKPVENATSIAKLTLRDGALSSLRRSRNLMQEQLGDRMDASQAQVAQIERKSDMLLSTLRRYVNALGGELDLVARFPGVSYHLGRLEDD